MAESTAAPLAPTDLARTAEAENAAPRGVMRNLYRDVRWQALGNVGVSVIALSMTLALVRLLGRDGFGAFGLVQTAGKWCALTFSFGASTNLLVQAGQCRHGDKSRVVGSSLIYLAMTVSVTWILVGLDPPGPGSLVMSQLSPGVGVLVVFFAATTAFLTTSSKMLQGADRFRVMNLVNLTWSALLATGAILGASLTGDYVGALWGGAVGMALVALAVVAMGVKSWGIALPSRKSFLKMGGSVGLRAYVVRIVEILVETFGVFYLSYRHDLAGVAAVVACQRIAMIVNRPATMAHALLKGKVAGQACGQAEARKALQLARFTLVAGTLLILPLIVCVRPFTRFALGEAFADAAIVMALFLLAGAFRAHSTTTSGILLGQGCRMFYVAAKVAVCAVTVTGVLLMGPAMGAAGVAAAYCIGSAVLAVTLAVGLSIQAKSARALFVGNDLPVLAKLLDLKKLFLDPSRSRSS
jgi:O-antigen/teichoic acid export membrane protein